MDETMRDALRADFTPEQIRFRPMVWCQACIDETCEVVEHVVEKCKVCGEVVTCAHDHHEYVSIAEVVDRLLDVDPRWTYEPGNIDSHGGLWIRLMVGGVIKPGYGRSETKGDIKAAISDAIKNAAKYFGVAAAQWKQEPLTPMVNPEPQPNRADELRAQVRRLAQKKHGDSLAESQQRFLNWVSKPGVSLLDADVPTLIEYKKHLEAK